MDLVEVKGISKRKKRPRILQVKDAWQILDEMIHPYRTIVLIALCFGLRISEILGLRWTDFDFKRSVVLIQRSAVGKRLNKLKTEYSQDEVPLERGFVVELKKWQTLCLDSEEGWLFPSPATGRPYHADSIRADYLVPTGLQLGLGRIGFHIFRHTRPYLQHGRESGISGLRSDHRQTGRNRITSHWQTTQSGIGRFLISVLPASRAS